MKLLRMPIKSFDGDTREQVTLNLDNQEIDRDYDTGHNLDIGNDRFYFESNYTSSMVKLEKSLHRANGTNLVPFQAFLSSNCLELSIGNTLCTELFCLLDQCPSDELNDLLRPFIYLQWSNLYPFAFGYLVIYLGYAALCYAFYGFLCKDRGLGISIIVISVVLMIFELLSLKTLKGRYLKSIWNSVDILTLIGSIIMVPLLWTQEVETRGWVVGRCVIMTIIWLRALTWLRIFRAVRYLITMVLRVFYDMIAYLVVLTGSVLGLAFIWRLSFYFPPDGDVEVGGREKYELVPSFFSSLQTVTWIILGNMPAPRATGESSRW